MNFLIKIFANAERYVGLCQVKRANRPLYTPQFAYKTTLSHFNNFGVNSTKNVYLSI